MLTPYNSTEFGVPQPGTTPPKYAWLGAAGISTETSLGSGVATQSGASYVPQVARALQTAPVVPPGAFPNGQGTGSQDTSVIPGWYVSLSGQQSAATLAEWPAKLKAREKEAEEALLRQCQAEGGCGAGVAGSPGQEQGGGEEGWEGSIGDPVGCNVHAYEPVQQETVFHHPLEGWATFDCQKPLIEGQFKVCIVWRDNGKWRNAACSPTLTVNGFSFDEFYASTDCTVGREYWTWAWVWEPGGGEGLAKRSSKGTVCQMNEAEEAVLL
jgi:hypothetical protein